MDILEEPSIKEWLDECRKPSTKKSYSKRITKFFEWYQKPVKEYLTLDAKAKRHTALLFQNQTNVKPNTVNGVLTALNSYLTYMDMEINFKGKRVRRQIDLTSHQFSNGDLGKMFDIGNVKEKAIISLGCSLGWEISAALKLEREFLKNLIARARAEGQKFIYFTSQRDKTGALRFGVLNSLAIEWLEKWLAESETLTPRIRKTNRKTEDIPQVSDLFDITPEGVNVMLKRLAKKAGIITTGRIHYHKIRAWVMSGLSRSGFNEWQTKFVMGKAIPMSDITYLETLKIEIEEKYPAAYEHYLNLKPQIPYKAVVEISKENQALKDRIDKLEKGLVDVKEMMANMVKLVEESQKQRAKSRQ